MLSAAFLSGVLGTVAASFSKAASSPPESFLPVLRMCERIGLPGQVCQALPISIRVGLFGTMLFINAVMVGVFLEGLVDSGSIAGTSLSLAGNFVASLAIGNSAWSEKSISPIWVVGVLVSVSGVLVLSGVSVETNKKRDAPR